VRRYTEDELNAMPVGTVLHCGDMYCMRTYPQARHDDCDCGKEGYTWVVTCASTATFCHAGYLAQMQWDEE